MSDTVIINILKTIIIVGALLSIYFLGFTKGYEKHQKNLDYVTNKYTELETKYNEKIEYCDKNHWELLRYGVDNND